MRFPFSSGAVVVALGPLSPRTAPAHVAPGAAACAALRQLQGPGAVLSEVTAEWFRAGSPPPQAPPWVPPLAVPRPAYCRRGATLDTFDMLGAVVDWVENQKAPEAIRVTGRRWPGRSRPLCPYPSHAHYRGTGDVEDAASFECR